MLSSKSNIRTNLEDHRWSFVRNEFKLIELLGEGSFGQVVRAKHRDSGKYFAIKLIKNIF